MQCWGQQGLLALPAGTQAEQQVRLLLPNACPARRALRDRCPHIGDKLPWRGAMKAAAASLGEQAGRAESQGHCQTAPNQSARSGLTIALSLGKQLPPPSPSSRSFTAQFRAQNLGDPGIIFSLVMFSSKEKLCGNTHLRQRLKKNILCPLSSIQQSILREKSAQCFRAASNQKVKDLRQYNSKRRN